MSIVGEELFRFQLSLFPGATEGDGYSDMSKVDGKVKMRLGCIQIIYLHKFLMSLLVRHADTHKHLNMFTSKPLCQQAEDISPSRTPILGFIG